MTGSDRAEDVGEPKYYFNFRLQSRSVPKGSLRIRVHYRFAFQVSDSNQCKFKLSITGLLKGIQKLGYEDFNHL